MLLLLIYSVTHVSVVASDNQVASEMNSFGLKLLEHLPADENTMISPFSICTAVAMLNAGAAGETKKQIDSAFGWSDTEDLSGQYKELLEKVKEVEDRQLTLSSNNRLYVDNSFTPLQSYSDELTTNFDADVEAVNFKEGDNSATVKKINAWVEEKTNNKIKNLFSSLSNSVRAILINTIYFKGNWYKPFYEKTSKEKFFLDETYAINADTMHLKDRLPYFENDDMELVKLPYVSREYQSSVSMVIIKPKTRGGLNSLERKIEYQFTEVSSWMSAAENSLLDLSMPTFKFDSGIEKFKELLENHFQIVDVFSANADLSGISAAKDLAVSSIVHKTFISVDQNGTEAAAATAIIMDKTSIPTDFPREVKIDQPFMFLIYDEESEVVFFIGRMMQPNSGDDSDKYIDDHEAYSGGSRTANVGGQRIILGIGFLTWLLFLQF